MLKKSTIAAVVAAVFAAPAAHAASEIAIHGDFRGSLDHSSGNGASGQLNWQDNLSRFGVDASTELHGMTGFVRYERLVSNDGDTANGENTLGFYGGIKSDLFGTVYVGQAPTAFRNTAAKIDPFFNTALARPGANLSQAPRGGASLGLSSPLTNDLLAGYAQNTVGYKSNDFGGLRVNAAVNIDEDSRNAPGAPGERHDYSAGVTFKQDALSAGLQYVNSSARSTNLNPTPKANNYFAHVGLDMGIAAVTAAYQRLHDTGGGNNANNYFVAGEMPLSDVLRVAATVGVERPSTTQSTTATGGNLGVFYDVVPNLTTYAGLRYTQQNAGGGSIKSESVAVGLSYNFRAAHSI